MGQDKIKDKSWEKFALISRHRNTEQDRKCDWNCKPFEVNVHFLNPRRKSSSRATAPSRHKSARIPTLGWHSLEFYIVKMTLTFGHFGLSSQAFSASSRAAWCWPSLSKAAERLLYRMQFCGSARSASLYKRTASWKSPRWHASLLCCTFSMNSALLRAYLVPSPAGTHRMGLPTVRQLKTEVWTIKQKEKSCYQCQWKKNRSTGEANIISEGSNPTSVMAEPAHTEPSPVHSGWLCSSFGSSWTSTVHKHKHSSWNRLLNREGVLMKEEIKANCATNYPILPQRLNKNISAALLQLKNQFNIMLLLETHRWNQRG